MNNRASLVLLALFGICATVRAQDADAIIAQADSLSKAKNYTAAIALLEKNLNLFETGTPGDALAWSRLGDYHYDVKDYEKAKSYYLKYIDSRKPHLESNPAQYANGYSRCLLSLANTYSKISDYPAAIRIVTENIELIERHNEHFENYSSDLAGQYGNLSWYYIFAKDYPAAEQAVQKALSIDSTKTWVKTNLAHVLLFQGKTQEAGTVYSELAQTVYHDNDTYAPTILEDFELLEKAQAIPQNAQKEIEKIKVAMSKVNELVEVYKRFETLCLSENKYEEAMRLIQPYISRLPKQHAQWAANILGNKGKQYKEMGNYAEAEKYYVEAKEIEEKVLGKEHLSYATSLNNLGVLYYAMGNYAEAEKYYAEAKEIREKVLGKEHPDYATSLNNLGGLYKTMGNYAETEKYYAEAKEIREKVLGKEHPGYAGSLNNLGALYGTMGNYAEAEKYYVESKEIIEKVLGKEHPSYALSLNNLGRLYKTMGNYAEAEKYYAESKEIWEKVLGKEHPDYASSLYNLFGLYHSMKDYEKASAFENTVCELTMQTTNRNFAFLSEQQRSLYWKTQADRFESGYSLSWFYPVAATNSLNYNNTLFTKGLLLRTATAVREAIYASGNRDLIGQYEQLGNLRKEINVLQQKTDYNKAYVQSLESRADSLDKALTQVSAAFRDLKADMSMTWKEVQSQLNSGEVAIEFVHFRLLDKKTTDTTLYAALVLREGMKSPAWIPLCEQRELQSALHTTARDTQEQTETLYSGKGVQLHRLVWQALEKELAGAKDIYYSPSGLLHKIAFDALPSGEEGSLLSDKYNLHLVSSTREIARLKKETSAAPARDTTVVYGGLTYDVRQSAMLAAARHYRNSARKPAGADRFVDRFRKRDAELPDADLRSGFSEWQYLAGTKTETEQIVTSLDSKHIPHKYYTGSGGNEESFKNLSGVRTGVIHLATHGFFLPDAENKAVNEIVQRLGGNREKPFENPLLRSGLIMSGANNQWLAKEYVMEEDLEDGILTADEIARLNLTKMKLVVLSACETGLGDVKNSEGVFGLQRAFKLAGVESLIMSLWKVPDEATAELMTTFYNEWLAGNTKRKAFKTAQQKVRAKYSSPYYWAAFVMMD
jgi:CHAT domain-containing protein/Flp pilus assembly protein TadD